MSAYSLVTDPGTRLMVEDISRTSRRRRTAN